MALKGDYEFLFFGKDDSSFLENYYYDLFEDFGEKSGQIFVNLEIENNPADAEEMGSVIFETMQKVFFEDIDRDPYERFEIALKEINKALAAFKGQKFSGYIGNLNVIVAAVVGDALYLSQAGDAEAYLIRKKYVSVVSEGLSDEGAKGNDVFESIASGKIEVGDVVLFATTRLLRYVSKTDLADCVKRRSVVETLENIKDAVSAEILGRTGLTGIVFSKAEAGDIQEIEGDTDNATKSILESMDDRLVSKRESMVGRFVAVVKNYKKGNKSPLFKGKRGGFAAAAKGWLHSFWNNLFTKGFGKDKVLASLIIVILVLTLGIWMVKSNSASRAEIERLDQVLQTVQDRIAEAETDGTYDKERARTILDKAEQDAMSVLNSGYYREKAQLYLMEIEEARDRLDNVNRVEGRVVADLSEKRSDVNALGLVQLGDRTFVYEYNALYEIVLDQVQDPLTIDDEEKVIAATGFDERASVVFLTESGKLIEFRGGTMSFMDTDDGSFRQAVAIEDWSNRIYLLDDIEGQIWRYDYRGTQEKFAGAEGYLAEGQDLDLSGAKDVAIDGSVYVLDDDGDIFKFYAGVREEMFINNAPFSSFQKPSKLFTNERLSQVYLLDSGTGRVLVFDKNSNTGNLDYRSQYQVDGVSDIRDIYVDAETDLLYVLTPTQLLEVDMNANLTTEVSDEGSEE